ncbi:MAG: exodeoxyribonuclease III [bacterium]
MIILSWNVNGIRAVVRNGFADFLKKANPDIICLQEIKIDNVKRAQEKFDFPDHIEYWNPAKKSGYSGTAVLTKQEPIKVVNGLGIKKFDDEGRVQTLEYKDFYLINTYFPHTRHDLSRMKFKVEFNQEVLKHVNKLENKKPVIITGDFNVAREEIDLTNPSTNHHNPGFTDLEREWGRKYIEKGLIDTFRYFYPKKEQYTWWSYRFNARAKNIGWRIDYFLVSKKFLKKVTKAYILDKVKGSDHCPIGIDVNIK